jgi:hypothetical protein
MRLKPISFIADRVDFGKKRVDGNRTVIFDVGEYEHEKLKDLFCVPDGVLIKVKIELCDSNEKEISLKND